MEYETGVFFAWACATAEHAMYKEAHHRVCLHQNGASQSYHSDYFARWSWRMCSWFNKMCSLQNKKLYRAPNNNKQPCSCQTSLRNLLFHLVQRISLHFKSTDLYLFCTTKVFPKFPLPFQSQASFQSEQFAMTMQHGRCHWSRAVWQVSGRACSCKKDPCYGE